MSSYGNRLRILRKQRKESITQAAKAIGISYQALQSYESEARIPRDAVKILIANYYNCSVSYIFFS